MHTVQMILREAVGLEDSTSSNVEQEVLHLLEAAREVGVSVESLQAVVELQSRRAAICEVLAGLGISAAIVGAGYFVFVSASLLGLLLSAALGLLSYRAVLWSKGRINRLAETLYHIRLFVLEPRIRSSSSF